MDEINQGMDPINERKVFVQLVESACKPDTPQVRVTPSMPGFAQVLPANAQAVDCANAMAQLIIPVPPLVLPASAQAFACANAAAPSIIFPLLLSLLFSASC